MRNFGWVLLVAGVLTATASACLWDHETLKQERSKFPTVLELITGRFPRHTPEFHRWRIQQRTARLKKDQTNDILLDDIAVSYEKLGEHQKAIQIAESQLKRNPQRYESLANLGTFHLHAGHFAIGLEKIKSAIAINPDAHFGREVYQARLVEYIQARKNSRPLRAYINGKGYAPNLVGAEDEFVHFYQLAGATDQQQQSAALKGVLGMMRFGNYDSEVLLEVLGNLLSSNYDRSDDLAARAFLQASYVSKPGPIRDAYRSLAIEADMPREEDQHDALKVTEPQFKKELREAKEWYEAFAKRERECLSSGRDPEQLFKEEVEMAPTLATAEVSKSWINTKSLLALGTSIAALILAGLLLRRMLKPPASAT
jgi:tetratricopeptide (TPR) repeat protein